MACAGEAKEGSQRSRGSFFFFFFLVPRPCICIFLNQAISLFGTSESGDLQIDQLLIGKSSEPLAVVSFNQRRSQLLSTNAMEPDVSRVEDSF